MKALLQQFSVALMIAAAAFLLATGGVLVFNQTHGKVAGLVASCERIQLIEQLHKHPKDDALKQRIRQLDLQLRQQTFTQLRLSSNGARAMIGALVLLLASAHLIRVTHRTMPNPLAWGARKTEDNRFARHAVSAVFGLLAATAFFLALQPVQLPERTTVVAETPEPPLTLADWQQNWPAFRGPFGEGVTKSAVKLKLQWKTPVPFSGVSSPVIWGNAVFLTGAESNQTSVLKFNANTGKLLWSSSVKISTPRLPPPHLNEDTGLAAPTPVTDGRCVYAIFANGDVAAFDFNGKQIWARNLGLLENDYGYASSLALWQNRLLIQLDLGKEGDGKSKMLALDTRTGRDAWETPRPTGGSWASPIVAMVDGKPQLITFGDPWILAYDPLSGAELWRAKALGQDIALSPIVVNGLVIACKANAEVFALRANGVGDVTASHLAWKNSDGAPAEVASPLSDGKRLYLFFGNSLLRCCDVATGKEIWAHDFGEEFYSSPALAGDTLVLITRKGVIFSIVAGDIYKAATKLELGEAYNSSPAFRGTRMYLRGKNNLFCFGE